MCKCKLVICAFISSDEMRNRFLAASSCVRQLSTGPYKRRSSKKLPPVGTVHVSSATSINVNLERPVARGAFTKVCLIFPHYIPKAYQGTHSKVNPFPGILYFTLSFNSVHPGIF